MLCSFESFDLLATGRGLSVDEASEAIATMRSAASAAESPIGGATSRCGWDLQLAGDEAREL